MATSSGRRKRPHPLFLLVWTLVIGFLGLEVLLQVASVVKFRQNKAAAENAR